MKILAISKFSPGITAKDFQSHLVAEAAKVWQFYTSGLFREMYYRNDQPGAVVILECAGVEEAKAVLGSLPAVEAGALDFDIIIPLGPFLSFSSLFSK